MSDWKKRNDDWRDEDELEEEEECECPWVDSKGKVRETAYCQYLLEKHPMMCLKQKLFDQNGEVDEDALLYEVHSDLRDFVLDNLAKKEKQVLDALRIETYTPEWKPQLDRIHLQNGTYFLDERGFVPEKELCLNRLPVEYQPDAPAPTKWLEFLDGLLIPEDILTLQEYLGYLLIPSTKAQKMLVMTGKGGEGKSRIGLLLKKLFGEASHSESILRIETNRFASANLEYKLVMVDDDLNMVALPETRNIKSIVTAEDRLCIERKNKQAVQGLLYVRFICFGNGNLVAAHDDSDEITKYEVSLRQDDDVKELKAKVQKQYEDAQTADPALAAFLDGLGEDVTGSAETADGTTLVVTEDCNVRAAASSDAEVIGGLSAGTEVVKKGESGDWIQIDYEGSEAYVHSSLLEEKTE